MLVREMVKRLWAHLEQAIGAITVASASFDDETSSAVRLGEPRSVDGVFSDS